MGWSSVDTFQRRVTVDGGIAIAGGAHAGLSIVGGQGDEGGTVQWRRVSSYAA